MAVNKNRIVGAIGCMLFAGAFGTNQDAFLHLSRGRESLLSLPHLFIYAGTFGAILAVGRLYLLEKTRLLLWLFRALCIIPFAGAFDDIWHRFKGKESIDSVSVIWSPPHALLFASAMAALVLFACYLKGISYKHKNLLGPAILGAFLSLLAIFLGPFLPTGPHGLLGTSGIAIFALVVVYTLMHSRKMFGSGAALVTAGILIIGQAIVYDSNLYIPEEINFLHTPVWLLTLMHAVPALLVEGMYEKYGKMSIGLLAGAAYAGTFYLLGSLSMPGNDFTYGDLWLSVVCSGIAGIIVGLVHEYHLTRNREA
jgi:hypothetical protein